MITVAIKLNHLFLIKRVREKKNNCFLCFTPEDREYALKTGGHSTPDQNTRLPDHSFYIPRHYLYALRLPSTAASLSASLFSVCDWRLEPSFVLQFPPPHGRVPLDGGRSHLAAAAAAAAAAVPRPRLRGARRGRAGALRRGHLRLRHRCLSRSIIPACALNSACARIADRDCLCMQWGRWSGQ
jgi:hypothetical protein